MTNWNHDVTGWGWVGMTLGVVAFWVLLLGGIWLLVRSGRRDGPALGETVRRTPEQLLAERFARGDIDETDFKERLAVLHQSPGS